MNKFNLQQHLNETYTSAPSHAYRPLIGITTNHEGIDATLREVYYKQIVSAGGTPVLIPPVADNDVLLSTLDTLDAIVLSGGGDFNPLWAGEQPVPQLHNINNERDLPELLLTRYAFDRQLPMLGICRGIQTLAMSLGGHVEQDIKPSPTLIKHSQTSHQSTQTHSVNIKPGTMLSEIFDGEDTIYVNSFHHQAVDNPGKHMRTAAMAPDGTIEAIESSEQKPIIGVQWHPEWLADDGLPLFRWLVNEAAIHHRMRLFHSRNITLDSHCDTPMFFPEGIHFDQRDPRILYDLHKMQEGGPDAVTMVAYLPQPKPGETFAQIAPLGAKTPREYADLIFDKIEDTILSDSRYIAHARSEADIRRNKRNGQRSLLTGIENGLAIEDDINNVQHFANRGITYITLCHNGDNQICDSARNSLNTHGGVSPFGAQVIAEMNRLGLMVDLSHAGEKSFYDALQISRTPIVCSHSNSRALCDVPRNITDEQMRALAAAGGVCQITLYNGFLRTDGNATITDAIRHLEHAIDIMGIEHVGLGTDFDGDGGIPGLADASELVNFTKALLRRRYSESDISLIWGGNWLRVMNLCQQSAQQ
ncbi:membrane dipeptidase [uncultured Prevotella sp.]|uniref:membrane dipeptidase n=1 Tax=uncultured Prevotella sp. TaxID=159272 RepID=UPI0025CE2D08|nr:membrane dipeptidase [uncultured Prevotella sp.]